MKILLKKFIDIHDSSVTEVEKIIIRDYMREWVEIRGNDSCYEIWYDLDKEDEEFFSAGQVESARKLHKLLDESGIEPDESVVLKYWW